MPCEDAMICTHCKGDGHLRLRFEAEEIVEQCWVCNSQGEVKENKYFTQSWDEGDGRRTYYHGPLLDPDGFKKYKIEKDLKKK